MSHYQLIKTAPKNGYEYHMGFCFFSQKFERNHPDYMLFQITSKELKEKMYPGMIISYKVSPVLNIKMTWITEITQVKEKQFFIDEQRLGPYKMWHHQHFFEEHENGVLMTDIITYIPPFGILGDIANHLFIKKQLEEIFNYRFNVLEKKFN